MNSFGRIFRIGIFGESHGELIGVTLDGVPSGIDLDPVDFESDLQKRKGELNENDETRSFLTSRKESDDLKIVSGVFNGKTTGAPITILIKNEDLNSKGYEDFKNFPRPGHADFASQIKYNGFNDYRGGGIFSGRLTAGLVCAGVVAKKVIKKINENIFIKAIVNSVGCFPYPSEDAFELLRKIKSEKDSIGGTIFCTIDNLPAGIGEPFFDSLESCISHIIFSIPGCKAISFGLGIESPAIKGSCFNDQIIDLKGTTKTNNNGGINGGISNGNQIYFTTYFKAASSVLVNQKTIDIKTGKEVELILGGRFDSCYVLRTPVIVEAATAIALLDLLLIYKTERL
jgi:chorismate synthase